MEQGATSQEKTSKGQEDSVELIDSVLQKFKGVFEMPNGMLPERGHEHVIRLKEGRNVVGVRPYYYPQFQRDEIEKFIRELLAKV